MNTHPFLSSAKASKIALLTPSYAISYETLSMEAEALANVLNDCARVGEGDRVGLVATSHPSFIVLYLATCMTGAVPFLLDEGIPAATLEEICDSYGFRALMTPGAESIGTRRIAPSYNLSVRERGYRTGEMRSGTTTCRFTSGTTGLPTALEFTSEAVLRSAKAWIAATSLQPTDTVLCLAPLANGLGFNAAMIPALHAGATLALWSGLPRVGGVYRFANQISATRIVAPPAFFELFGREGNPRGALSNPLALAICAAAPLSERAKNAFRASTGVRIADYYGIAETGPVTFEDQDGSHSGLGRPIDGALIDVDPGTSEVLVRTGWMASGYVDNRKILAERFTASGYYRSNDKGFIDPSGRLHVVDRLDNLVNVAGSKVDPRKISDLCLQLDDVADAFAFGEPDPISGDRLVLCFVSEKPDDIVDRVRAHCAAHLPAKFVPSKVVQTEHIPRNSVGKVILHSLRNHISTTMEQSNVRS
jgi:acyl-coenzyme A synthetase/AMP-(fatty) acid ligase